MTHNDWEAEFDEKFPPFKGVGARFPMFNETPVRTHIIQFIRSLLESERTRIAKEVEKLGNIDKGIDTSYFVGRHNTLIDVLNLLKP